MIRAPRSFLSVARIAARLSALPVALCACSNNEPIKPDPALTAGAKAEANVPVEWVVAPADGDTAGVVARELARAKADRRTLLVYVGAAWCEPCERFHRAASKGELNSALSGLRFLAFDLDRDRDALDQAGYSSRMIPLFVVPQGDGRASTVRMEGGVKGEGAAGEITARLQRLLAKAPR